MPALHHDPQPFGQPQKAHMQLGRLHRCIVGRHRPAEITIGPKLAQLLGLWHQRHFWFSGSGPGLYQPGQPVELLGTMRRDIAPGFLPVTVDPVRRDQRLGMSQRRIAFIPDPPGQVRTMTDCQFAKLWLDAGADLPAVPGGASRPDCATIQHQNRHAAPRRLDCRRQAGVAGANNHKIGRRRQWLWAIG